MRLFSTTRQTTCIADVDDKLQIRQVKMVRHSGGSLLINEKARVNQTSIVNLGAMGHSNGCITLAIIRQT